MLVLSVAALGAVAVVASAATQSGDAELSTSEALLLGVIEGVTEYLPVSSTAHLAITEDLLGLTGTPEGRKAADSYVIVIQFGAIAAVLGLYRGRLLSLGRGVFSTDPQGRRLSVAILVAFTHFGTPAVTITHCPNKGAAVRGHRGSRADHGD